MYGSLLLPDRALQIKWMEVGEGIGSGDWKDEKTVPYTIVAQAISGGYEVESALGAVRVSGEEAFLAPANTPLRIVHRAPAGASKMTYRFIHFQFTIYETVDVFSIFALPPKTDAVTGRRLGELIGELIRLAAGPQTIPVLAERNALAYRIASTLLGISSPLPGAGLIRDFNEDLMSIVAFIRERLSEPLAVHDLLRRFPYSRSALFKLFKRYFAQSPMDYVKTVRLNEAYRHICMTSDSFSSIAERCGFANLQHFSREYKQKFQLTPSETRRKNRLWLSGGAPEPDSGNSPTDPEAYPLPHKQRRRPKR